jgi:hypothetical protein
MYVRGCPGPSLRSFRRSFLGLAVGLGCGFGIRDALQMMADLFRNFDRDRAGMRFFLSYAKARQKVNNRLSLDLQLTGKFINSYLGCVTHTA